MLRILKFEKNMKCNDVEVLLTAWKTQHEKLQGFISQQFSLRKDEITGMQRGFFQLKITLSATCIMIQVLSCWHFLLCLQVY